MKNIGAMTMGVLLTIEITAATAGTFSRAEAPNFISPTSLCHSGEVQYFGCELRDSKKIASICAAHNVSPDSGYVQYRFGTHNNIEYKFPRNLIPPRGKMSIVDVSRLRDGLGSHLKFTSESYTYVVSNALVPGEIYVAKSGKIVFDQICKGGGYVPFDSAARQGLEYGIVTADDALDRHGD